MARKTMKKLSNDIKNGTYEPVYLICGPESYLRRRCKSALKQAICADDEMNYAYFEGDKVSLSAVTDLALTLPFFADRRLIVLENTGWLKKGGEDLADFLPQLPPFTVLVLVEEEVDKRSRLYKACGKTGYVVECATAKDADRKKEVLLSVKKAGLQITQDAMDLFLLRCEDDLEQLHSELDKLIAYCLGKDGIREEDVAAITTVTPQNRVFDMLDKAISGKPDEALRLYQDLMALREAPLKILFLMTQHVNRLLQVKDWKSYGRSEDNIAEEMNLRSFAVRKYAYQSMRFDRETLAARLEYLVELDQSIKNGNISDTVALELALTSLGKR